MSVAQRMRLLVDVDKTTPQATPKNDLYQGDKNANQIVLEMMRGGEKVNLQGYAASASMERSDGSQVPCTGEVTDSTVTITLNEHCYVFAGPYTLDIELSGGSDGLRRTVAQITGTVRKTASGPVVEVEEEIVDVDAVLALYAEMKQAKDDANSATTAANNAAASANSAATEATTATSNANAATTAASNAAQTANTAASNANAATTNAINAAGAANEAAGRAEIVASKSPYIGDNGNWYVYDVEQGAFVDSGSSAKGLGDVSSVDGIHPDSTGDVPFTADGAGAHNARYRGKNLGSSVTAEQYAVISDGTFKGLFIGDFWSIGGINYRIADFDYYYKTGDTQCLTHHIVIVPDSSLYDAQMHDSMTTDGAYVGSQMYKQNLDQAKQTILSAFGASHVLTHRQYLKNAVTAGIESGGSWYDSQVELMTESNVFGHASYANVSNGTTQPNQSSLDNSQYMLFRHRHDMISNRNWYWMRDVVSDNRFAGVSRTGYPSYAVATETGGVRPSFGLVG